MLEKELVQKGNLIETMFRMGDFLIDHNGRELRVECAEVRGENSMKSTFSIRCFAVPEVHDEERISIPVSGSIGISKIVAFSALSEVLRESILRQIITVRNTSSPEGDGTL